jgi:hypothetical protein
MELSVTDRIWQMILQMVAIIADMFSADEEEIVKNIIANNEKCNRIEKLYEIMKAG